MQDPSNPSSKRKKLDHPDAKIHESGKKPKFVELPLLTSIEELFSKFPNLKSPIIKLDQAGYPKELALAYINKYLNSQYCRTSMANLAIFENLPEPFLKYIAPHLDFMLAAKNMIPRLLLLNEIYGRLTPWNFPKPYLMALTAHPDGGECLMNLAKIITVLHMNPSLYNPKDFPRDLNEAGEKSYDQSPKTYGPQEMDVVSKSFYQGISKEQTTLEIMGISFLSQKIRVRNKKNRQAPPLEPKEFFSSLQKSLNEKLQKRRGELQLKDTAPLIVLPKKVLNEGEWVNNYTAIAALNKYVPNFDSLPLVMPPTSQPQSPSWLAQPLMQQAFNHHTALLVQGLISQLTTPLAQLARQQALFSQLTAPPPQLARQQALSSQPTAPPPQLARQQALSSQPTAPPPQPPLPPDSKAHNLRNRSKIHNIQEALVALKKVGVGDEYEKEAQAFLTNGEGLSVQNKRKLVVAFAELPPEFLASFQAKYLKILFLCRGIIDRMKLLDKYSTTFNQWKVPKQFLISLSIHKKLSVKFITSLHEIITLLQKNSALYDRTEFYTDLNAVSAAFYEKTLEAQCEEHINHRIGNNRFTINPLYEQFFTHLSEALNKKLRQKWEELQEAGDAPQLTLKFNSSTAKEDHKKEQSTLAPAAESMAASLTLPPSAAAPSPLSSLFAQRSGSFFSGSSLSSSTSPSATWSLLSPGNNHDDRELEDAQPTGLWTPLARLDTSTEQRSQSSSDLYTPSPTSSSATMPSSSQSLFSPGNGAFFSTSSSSSSASSSSSSTLPALPLADNDGTERLTLDLGGLDTPPPTSSSTMPFSSGLYVAGGGWATLPTGLPSSAALAQSDSEGASTSIPSSLSSLTR